MTAPLQRRVYLANTIHHATPAPHRTNLPPRSSWWLILELPVAIACVAGVRVAEWWRWYVTELRKIDQPGRW